MKKNNEKITIRSSAAEYLTYVASVGDQKFLRPGRLFLRLAILPNRIAKTK